MAGDKMVSSISYLKKKPGLTLEEFYDHWENVHAPLVKPWMEKHGFVSYTQASRLSPSHQSDYTDPGSKVHSTSLLQQTGITRIGPQTSGLNPLLEYDGTAVIEAPSLDVLTTAFEDEYYKTVIAPDEDRFIDKPAGILRSVGEAKRILGPS